MSVILDERPWMIIIILCYVNIDIGMDIGVAIDILIY